MTTGFRVRIRQRPHQAVLVKPRHDRLDLIVVVVAQQGSGHRAKMHGVTHRGARAAITCNRLNHQSPHIDGFPPCRSIPSEPATPSNPRAANASKFLRGKSKRRSLSDCVGTKCRLTQIDNLLLQRALHRGQRPLEVKNRTLAPRMSLHPTSWILSYPFLAIAGHLGILTTPILDLLRNHLSVDRIGSRPRERSHPS